MDTTPTFWHVNDFRISKAKRSDMYYLIDPHYHDVYEIYYLISGTRRQIVDNRIYDVREGDLVLIPRRAIHMTTRIDRNEHSRYMLNFSDDFILPIVEEMGVDVLDLVFNTTTLSVPEEQRDYLLNLLDEINRESTTATADMYSAMLVRNYMAELFAFIVRLRRRYPSDNMNDNLEEEKIQMAMRYIADHYNQDLTLSSMAQYTYMSETYFSKKFKKITGINFSEYLISVRLQRADELLLMTTLPISKVAERCGFSNANYFGTIFRRAKGVSPLQYRKAAKGSDRSIKFYIPVDDEHPSEV